MRTLFSIAVFAVAGIAQADPATKPAAPAVVAPVAAAPVELRTFEPKFQLAAPEMDLEIRTRAVADRDMERKLATKSAKRATSDASVMRAPAKPAILDADPEAGLEKSVEAPAKDAGAR